MQRKIHNQTLFVAALSVYLGLLIVGAPPQVLAQTKIVSDKNIAQSIAKQNLYGDTLNNLIVELNELSKKGKFDWNQQVSSDYGFFSICESDNSPSFEGSTRNINDERLMRLFDVTAEKIVRDFIRIEAVSLKQPNWRGTFELSIKSDKSGLIIEIKPSRYNEDENIDFVGAYAQFFEQEKVAQQTESVAIIYQNTQVLGEKSNFLIITRLPRAGLDALPKADEKAN